MSGYEVDNSSHITFHPLYWRREGDNYILGREEISSYIELPEVGAQAIKLLEGGLTVKDVQEQLKQRLGKDFDIKSLVSELIDVGFIKSIDEYMLEEKREVKKYLFTRIRQRHVKWLFSKPSICLSTLLIVAGFLILVLNPRYWPDYQDFFFHERYTVVVLVSLALGWLLVFTHEMAHLFASKAVGVEGWFSISNRLHYVVAETDLTNLWKVPRSRRYIVYLAGMISDLEIASVLIILNCLLDSHVLGGSGGGLYRIAKMMILVKMMGVAWQFMFFMRTDIYYVVANFFKCRNLFGDALTLAS